MDIETIRPIISGLIGAAIAGWLGTVWAKWIPETVGLKSRQQLEVEYGWHAKFAYALSIVGIFSGVAFYQLGWFVRNDWRGLGLGIGLMAFLPIFFIIGTTSHKGLSSTRECMVYYAISQKTPPAIHIGLLVLCMIGGVVALSHL